MGILSNIINTAVTGTKLGTGLTTINGSSGSNSNVSSASGASAVTGLTGGTAAQPTATIQPACARRARTHQPGSSTT